MIKITNCPDVASNGYYLELTVQDLFLDKDEGDLKIKHRIGFRYVGPFQSAEDAIDCDEYDIRDRILLIQDGHIISEVA